MQLESDLRLGYVAGGSRRAFERMGVAFEASNRPRHWSARGGAGQACGVKSHRGVLGCAGGRFHFYR